MSKQAILAQVSFARQLSDTVLRQLAAGAIERHVERGTVITLEGEPARAMYIVATGRVKIVRHSLEGREQIMRIAEQFEHFNTVPLFDQGPCPATTEALVTSDLLELPTLLLRQLASAHSELALALLDEFAGRLRELVRLVETLALHTVNGRLARLLLDQAEDMAQGRPTSPLTQADMAARIGSVREMVGRTLKSFEAGGLIRMERGAISIVDPEGLEQAAAT